MYNLNPKILKEVEEFNIKNFGKVEAIIIFNNFNGKIRIIFKDLIRNEKLNMWIYCTRDYDKDDNVIKIYINLSAGNITHYTCRDCSIDDAAVIFFKKIINCSLIKDLT